MVLVKDDGLVMKLRGMIVGLTPELLRSHSRRAFFAPLIFSLSI
jgi:hypothetical protein